MSVPAALHLVVVAVLVLRAKAMFAGAMDDLVPDPTDGTVADAFTMAFAVFGATLLAGPLLILAGLWLVGTVVALVVGAFVRRGQAVTVAIVPLVVVMLVALVGALVSAT